MFFPEHIYLFHTVIRLLSSSALICRVCGFFGGVGGDCLSVFFDADCGIVPIEKNGRCIIKICVCAI